MTDRKVRYKIITCVIQMNRKGGGPMARKESVTKNDILEAAFSILQEEGIEQVTARKLAARANCSTQPIFRIYKNINELIEELFFKSCEFFRDYYRAFPRQSVTPFVNLGYAYILFAQKNKKIFEFVFLSKDRHGKTLYDLINGEEGYVSREIQSAAAQGCKNASELFMKMWIFIHGAASMSLTDDYDLKERETIEMLKDAYQAFR